MSKIAFADHILEMTHFQKFICSTRAGANTKSTYNSKLKRIDYHSAFDQNQLKNFIINLKKLIPTLKNQNKF